VSLEENPAHRRSKHVRATAQGRARLRAMLRRENALLGATAEGLDPRALADAASLLRSLRGRVDDRLDGPLDGVLGAARASRRTALAGARRAAGRAADQGDPRGDALLRAR